MRLQNKVMLFFFCLFILLMVQWVFFITYEHKIFYQEMEDKERLVSENLAEISRDPIVNYKFSRLINQIHAIKAETNITYIRIVNDQHMVLADTRDKLEGWIFSGPLISETTVEFSQEKMLVTSPIFILNDLIGNVEVEFSLDAFNTKLQKGTMIFLVFLFFEVLISILFGFFTELQFVKPLDQLTRKVTNITTVSVKESINISSSAIIEIKQVSDAVEQMEVDLKRAQQKIVEKTKMATMGKIAANFAHEIRNPLEAISGSVEILSYHIDKEAEETEYLMIIREEIENLNDYLEHFLQFSRLPKMLQTQVDLSSVVHDILLLLRPIYTKKKIHCTAVIDTHLPECLADEGQIKRALINIMLNSIESIETEHGKKDIHIEVFSEDPDIILRVEDTGKGIDEDTIDHIFEPYFTTKPDGSGIGLALCKTIIERHNGTIAVTSSAGAGTAVSLRLPIHNRYKIGEKHEQHSHS